MVTGQVTAEILSSETLRALMVTLPVFSTSNSYVSTSPTAAKSVSNARLTIDSSGAGAFGVTDSSVVVGGNVPPAGTALNVAVFVMAVPASISAWVT